MYYKEILSILNDQQLPLCENFTKVSNVEARTCP